MCTYSNQFSVWDKEGTMAATVDINASSRNDSTIASPYSRFQSINRENEMDVNRKVLDT
jgi:hypothetical protein